MSLPSADLADIEDTLLRSIDSPEVKAVILSLVQAVAATVESKTGNPFLRTLEEGAFALVQGYLSPSPVVPSPVGPGDAAPGE